MTWIDHDRSTPELVFLVCQFILERDYLVNHNQLGCLTPPRRLRTCLKFDPMFHDYFMIISLLFHDYVMIDHPFLLVDLCVVPHVDWSTAPGHDHQGTSPEESHGGQLGGVWINHDTLWSTNIAMENGHL